MYGSLQEIVLPLLLELDGFAKLVQRGTLACSKAGLQR